MSELTYFEKFRLQLAYEIALEKAMIAYLKQQCRASIKFEEMPGKKPPISYLRKKLYVDIDGYVKYKEGTNKGQIAGRYNQSAGCYKIKLSSGYAPVYSKWVKLKLKSKSEASCSLEVMEAVV